MRLKRLLSFALVLATLVSLTSCVADWENWYDVIPDVQVTQFVPEDSESTEGEQGTEDDSFPFDSYPPFNDQPTVQPGDCTHHYVSNRCGYCGSILGSEGLIYELNEDGESYSLIGGYPEVEKLYVASEYNGLPVTRIENYALYENLSVKQLMLPDSIETIGSGAFFGCNSLKIVILPKNIKLVSGSAFYGCRKLKSVLLSFESPMPVDVTFEDTAFPDVATYYYYSSVKPYGGNYWHYADGNPAIW